MRNSVASPTTAGLLLILLQTAAAPVAAQEREPAFPRIDGEVPVELQNNLVIESDDDTAEVNDLFTTIEPALSFRATRRLSLEAGLVLEPVRDPGPDEDRAFRDHGLYAEQLYVSYAGDGYTLLGGKFNPSFGTAWDATPGVFGTDLAEDYEVTERIGVGGSLTLGEGGFGPAGIGTHTLSAGTFFADTTFLSGSAFTDRGDVDKADGGVSNTEDFSSFAVTLDGEDFSALPIGYHVGVQHQEAGIGDREDQQGLVAGLDGSFVVDSEVTVAPRVEVAVFDGFGGARQDRTYLTAGTSVFHGPWNAALSYTGRFIDNEAPGTRDFDDGQIQVSGGYTFANGLTADLGYKYVEEGRVDSHVVGVLVTYAFDFSLPL